MGGVTTLHPDPTSTRERRTAAFSVDSYQSSSRLEIIQFPPLPKLVALLLVVRQLLSSKCCQYVSFTSLSHLGPLTAVFISPPLRQMPSRGPASWLSFCRPLRTRVFTPPTELPTTFTPAGGVSCQTILLRDPGLKTRLQSSNVWKLPVDV